MLESSEALESETKSVDAEEVADAADCGELVDADSEAEADADADADALPDDADGANDSSDRPAESMGDVKRDSEPALGARDRAESHVAAAGSSDAGLLALAASAGGRTPPLPRAIASPTPSLAAAKTRAPCGVEA